MKKLLLIPAIAGLLGAVIPVAASAALTCPVRSSIFGTVNNVHPTELTLDTVPSEFGRMGHIHVISNGAHVNANGLPLRPGVFAGVYGCLTPNHRQFNAEDITLAQNESAYEAYPARTSTIQGRIDTVRNGHFLLDSNGGHGDVWVYSNQGGFRAGQLVTVTGNFSPRDQTFTATSVAVVR